MCNRFLYNKFKIELENSILNGNKDKLWIKIQRNELNLTKKLNIIRNSLKQRRDTTPWVNVNSIMVKKINLSREIAGFAKVISLIKDSRYSSDYYDFPSTLMTFYLFNLCAIQTSRVGRN